MFNTKSFLAFMACIYSAASPAYELILAEEVYNSDGKPEVQYKLNQEAMDSLFETAKNVIYLHKTGIHPRKFLNINRESGEVNGDDAEMNLYLEEQPAYTKVTITIDGLNLNPLSIERVSYFDEPFVEDISINSVVLESESGTSVHYSSFNQWQRLAFEVNEMRYSLLVEDEVIFSKSAVKPIREVVMSPEEFKELRQQKEPFERDNP